MQPCFLVLTSLQHHPSKIRPLHNREVIAVISTCSALHSLQSLAYTLVIRNSSKAHPRFHGHFACLLTQSHPCSPDPNTGKYNARQSRKTITLPHRRSCTYYTTAHWHTALMCYQVVTMVIIKRKTYITGQTYITGHHAHTQQLPGTDALSGCDDGKHR